jgi:FkbM family methyltransferase
LTVKKNREIEDSLKTVEVDVRGTLLRLAAYTRALTLCARMNRETEVLDFIDSMPPDAVMYDLGACEGRFAVYAALRNIRCYAFEPEAMNFAAKLRNIDINGDRAKALITPFNLAVGERTRTGNLKIAQPWAGGHQKVLDDGSTRVDLDFNFTSDQEVQVVAIDPFVSEYALPPPDFLKVDVDGSERSFIKGSIKTLQSKQLKGIMFELHERDTSYDEVVSFLQTSGFAIRARFEVEPGLFNIRFERRSEMAGSGRELKL